MKFIPFNVRRATQPVQAVMVLSLLAACGGGGGGEVSPSGNPGGDPTPPPEPDEYVAFLNDSSTQQTPLSFVAVNVSNDVFTGNAGSLDHDADLIRNGLLAGTFQNSRTRIQGSGASAELTNPENNIYARMFSTSGLSNDGFGVAGLLTKQADIPTIETSTYDGFVDLQVDTDLNTSFALQGDAEITVGWGTANDVDILFDNFKNKVGNAGVNGNVRIDNAGLSGSGFSGGDITTQSTNWTYTGGGTDNMEGRFFGPDASEAGGAFDLTSDQVDMTGVFIAKER